MNINKGMFLTTVMSWSHGGVGRGDIGKNVRVNTRYFTEVNTGNSWGTKKGVDNQLCLEEKCQERLERRDVASAESCKVRECFSDRRTREVH